MRSAEAESAASFKEYKTVHLKTKRVVLSLVLCSAITTQAEPILTVTTEPLRLTETEMDRVTAGVSVRSTSVSAIIHNNNKIYEVGALAVGISPTEGEVFTMTSSNGQHATAIAISSNVSPSGNVHNFIAAYLDFFFGF